MNIIREQGKRMSEAQPSETAVGNMARRGQFSSLVTQNLFKHRESQLMPVMDSVKSMNATKIY